MIDVQPRSFPARALEFLLPQRCLECGRFGASLHEECVATLVRAERPRCRVCWAPSRVLVCARCLAAEDHSGFDELRTPLRFTGTARRALLEAKFRGVTTLLPPLARLAATSVEPVWRPEVVIPIPLARQRERRRGFNQAQLIAAEVAAALALPLDERGLTRLRASAAQASLGAAERATNLEDAFRAAQLEPTSRARGLVGARVLLVDDVTTTGSTLNEAARALRAGGAAAVFALAVARED
ncbi:MAG: phosphoribosyltransferase family protein [Chloroflexi bacterium]|nr:phosphoribosyltransferase family protein [Chloroflexota bacterium]MDA1146932.1 phosphoribosyltransferase family protein [Chloroflexota bacterium]